jgi:ferredoxin-nitrite reductase
LRAEITAMNKVEVWKAEKHGFDVWNDLVGHAQAGTAMADIAEADLERLKWYGIFYRKRVEDGRYMIRVRVPGCELTARQARALATVARLGYSILDVTTRGNVQIQGFHISELPAVVAELEASGLTSRQTGHDNVRNVMTHPWAGLDPEELLDVRPLCKRLTDVFLGKRELSNLPRKFNVAVDGRPIPAPHCWTQDTSFVAAERPDGSVAFHWLLAGTQGQNPRIAWKMPVWVREDQACSVLRAALEVFREDGSREKRDKARLRYLIEQIGELEFLQRVEARLGFSLERSETPVAECEEPEDFVGWFAQKQEGLWALGVSVPLGRLTHEQFDGLAELAETFGDATLRTVYDQGIVVPNIPASGKRGAIRSLNRLGLEHESDTLARNILACTGRQFCNIAVSETKGHAFSLIDRLRAKGVKLAGIKIHMSGCPSSCAQTYIGDIGLKGVRVRRPGGTQDGFDIFLGGGAHGPVELGRLYRKGVDVDQLPEVIEDLVRTYDREGRDGETFSRFWRERLGPDHAADTVNAEDFRPDIWICDGCGHNHAGVDPPIFCPKCAGLRKHFARADAQPSNGSADTVAIPLQGADGFQDVGACEALVRNGRMTARLGEQEVALFQVGSDVRCVDALCPHEAGPLIEGDLVDGVVSCPWHGWTFRTDNGCAADGNGCSLKTYATKIENGRILVAKGVAPEAKKVREDVPEVALTVIDIIDETPDTKTIRLDNSQGSIPVHRPGQHIKVCVTGPQGAHWRSFTLSSAPTRPKVLEVTVKRNPDGIVSNAIHTLQSGDMLTIKGPQGRFYFDPETHREPLVIAVAGSGVTPGMSIVRTICDRQLDLPVTLLYGARTRDDVIFARELDAMRLRLAQLRVVVTLSRPDSDWSGAMGRVDAEMLARHVSEPARARYFVCGPGDMRESLTAWLLGRGVPSERIHTEMFGKPTRTAAAGSVLADRVRVLAEV